jgi:hypothetical protein
MAKFFYTGGSYCDGDCLGYAYPYINGSYYMNIYIEVSIIYGTYIRSDTLQAMPPVNLPPLADFVNITMNACQTVDGTTPGSLDSTPQLVFKQNIFDWNNPNNCLGAKFTFATRTYPGSSPPYYVGVWSTAPTEILYGVDSLILPALSGVTQDYGW